MFSQGLIREQMPTLRKGGERNVGGENVCVCVERKGKMRKKEERGRKQDRERGGKRE